MSRNIAPSEKRLFELNQNDKLSTTHSKVFRPTFERESAPCVWVFLSDRTAEHLGKCHLFQASGAPLLEGMDESSSRNSD